MFNNSLMLSFTDHRNNNSFNWSLTHTKKNIDVFYILISGVSEGIQNSPTMA